MRRKSVLLEMEIPTFDDGEDAYWWVICMDRYFDAMGTDEEEKMRMVAKVMRGEALVWWLCWICRHPEASWETFSWGFLWRYKPYYRDVLPPPDAEEKLDLESEVQTEVTPNMVEIKTDEEGVFNLELEGSVIVNNNGMGCDIQTEVILTIEEEIEKKMKLDPDLNSSTKEKEEVSLLTGALFSRLKIFQSLPENIHTELSMEERKTKQEATINPKPPPELSNLPLPEPPPDSG